MPLIGYHASHEQFAPSTLLECVRLAEQAGFAAAISSDHLAPWGEAQGHSGFALSWLGAAMQATALPFSVVTTPIGLRYHPLLIAQAGATLAEMFPGRLSMALGSGEALNERAFGMGWPIKSERERRLAEAVEIMRALWRGETVTYDGLITIAEGRVYSLPQAPPKLIVAALTPQTARNGAGWGEGLVTVNQPPEKLRPIIDAYREASGKGELHLQVHLSYAGDERQAEENAAAQWRTNALAGGACAELPTPQMFDAATGHVGVEDLRDSVLISADPARHAASLGEYAEMGVRPAAAAQCRHQPARIHRRLRQRGLAASRSRLN